MESIAKKLQHVAMPKEELDRAVAMAEPTNRRVREAADVRLKFEDEPAAYAAFLKQQ